MKIDSCLKFLLILLLLIIPVFVNAEEIHLMPGTMKQGEIVENTVDAFIQQDGLFKINLWDGWKGQEMPGRVVILPPPPRGNGIVIQYKLNTGDESAEAIKKRVGSAINNIAEYKIKPMGGQIIENKEMMIDGVPAQYLLYSVTLKGESMYFFRVMFDNKGHSFSIDYGDSDRLEIDKATDLLKTLRF